MCYKYVRLAGAILISCFIMSSSMANMQIDGVIDIGKDSYKYKVILPDQKDNSTPKITQWASVKEQGQVKKQSKIEVESRMNNQTHTNIVTKQPTTKNEKLQMKINSRKHATPMFNVSNETLQSQIQKKFEEQKESQIQKQLQIQENSRKQEAVNSYFSSINERLSDLQSPKEKQSEEKIQEHEQLRLQEQLHLQERFQNKHSREQDRSNPYFNPDEERISGPQEQMKVQSEGFEMTQLQEHAQMQDRIQNKNLHIQDYSNPYYNPVLERVADQQQQIKKSSDEQGQSQELKQSQFQNQQQMYERVEVDKISRMQDKSNSYFNPINERLVNEQQIKKQREEKELSQASQNSQIEEQQQMQEQLREQQQVQERFQSDKNLQSQDMSNLYMTSANDQTIGQQQHIKTQSADDGRSQELLQSQEQQHLQERLQEQQQLQERLKEQQQMQERVQEQQQMQEQVQEQQQMQEQLESEKKPRSQATSNLYSNTVNKRLIGQEIKNQTQERGMTEEVIQSRLQKQQQMQEQFQSNNNARLQDTSNSYFDLANKHLVDYEQQIKKQYEEDEQPEEHLQSQSLQHKQITERFYSDNNAQPQDTSNINFNPLDEHLIFLQQEMKKHSYEQDQLQKEIKKQPEEQGHSQEHKHYQLQEQQQMQERFYSDNISQAQDTSNQNFNPLNERSISFKQRMKIQSDEQGQIQEHKQSELQGQQWMQEQFQSDSPLPQDTSHSYFNSMSERLVQQQQEMKNLPEELVLSQERKQTRSHEQPHLQDRLPLKKNLRTQETSNAYLNPENKGLVDQQQMSKIQAEAQEKEAQEQFLNDENFRVQDKPVGQQPHIKKQSPHSPKQTQMQNIFEIDKNLRTQDGSQMYSNINEKPLDYPDQIKIQYKSEEQEQSKEQSRLQKPQQMREQFQAEKNFRANDTLNLNAKDAITLPFNTVNRSLVVQKPQMKAHFDEEQQFQEYDQKEPNTPGLFGIDINLEIQDSSYKNFYSLNKYPIGKKLQISEQSEGHSRSYENSQGYEESRIPSPPQTQGLFNFHDRSRNVETPNPYGESVNKHDQSEIYKMLQLQDNLRTHKTSNPNVISIKNRLKDDQTSRYQQSRSKGQSMEQGPMHIQGNYQIHDHTQELKQRAEQSRIVNQQTMQEISQNEPKQYKTQNPYIISVNKRTEEERIQLKETAKPQTLQQLQTKETLNPFISSVIKLLSDKISQIQNQSQILGQSREHSQPYREQQSQLQDTLQQGYQLHDKPLSQIQNQSERNEMSQVQRSRIQGISYKDEKTPKSYFYSVNKRLSEEQSKLKDQSQIHSNLQTPHVYSHTVNKHQSVEQVQERSQYYRHIKTQETISRQKHRTQETKNPFFKSVNKRLENEQTETQAPFKPETSFVEMSSRHIHSVNKRITMEFEQEDMQKPSHEKVTSNHYMHSVKHQFTDGEYLAQETFKPRDKHKHLEATPNRHFHSVNKRLTTGETDDRYYEKERSDYDQFAPEWFETSATAKHKKIHNQHHHRDSQSDSEYHEHHEYHEQHQHHELHEQRKVKITTFEDLTIRKQKRGKPTTISHMHSHRQYKTLSKHDYFNTDNVLASKSKQNEKHTKWDPFIEFQQRHTTKAIGLKKMQISKTYKNVFTTKNYYSNPLRQARNITSKKIFKNTSKVAQQPNNNISALEIANVPIYNKLVTQMVTNLTFNDMFGHSKKIKHDAQIQTFTSHILQSGLNVFAVLKEKATDYAIKIKIDELAEKYETKYKEFLTDTCRHEIKTSLGKQKVILNAIDVSDRILKRLMNYIVAEMDQKGHLRDNIATAVNFQQEVDKETNLQFNHVCKKFGICRTGNGFPNFLVEYLTIILRCDDAKFKLAMDSLTESTKNMDLSDSFDKKTRQVIKNTVNRLELLDIKTLRPAFMIVKNIIANKNKPLVVSKSESRSGRINSTLALLEIIDIFEEKIPRTDANIINWGDLRTNLDDWSQDRRSDVVTTMESFVNYLNAAVQTMPYELREHIAHNLERVINVY